MMRSDTDPAQATNDSQTQVPTREPGRELAPLPAPYPGGPQAIPGVGGGPPGMAGAFSFPHLLRALSRRWILATFGGILAAVLGTTAVYFLMPPKYVVTTIVSVESNTPTIAFDLGKEQDLVSYQKYQAGLLKSRSVLTRALAPQNIADLSIVREQPDVFTWLEKDLLCDFTSNNIMRLTMIGDRPQEYEKLLNSIVATYMEEVVMRERRQRLEKLELTRIKAGDFNERLRLKRRTQRELIEAVGSGNPFVIAVKQQFQTQELNDKQRELLKLRSDLMHDRTLVIAEEAKLKTLSPQTVDEAAVLKAISNNLSLHPIDSQMQALQSRGDQMAGKFEGGWKSPQLAKYKEQLDALKAQRAQKIEQVRPDAIKEVLISETALTKSHIKNLRGRVELNSSMEATLKSEVDKLMGQMNTVTAKATTLETEQKDADQIEGVVKALNEMVAKLEIEAGAPPRVSVWEGASSRLAQTPQKQYLMAGAGGVVAMVLFIFGVGYWEFMARRIMSGDDVITGLGWRLIGSLPALPTRARKGFVGGSTDEKYWHSLLTESVDATRTMLLHAARNEGVRSVMVTSAVAGEGKTSLSCHLATSLARAGRKTLLLDCDLRSPAAHRLFELPAEPGVCELLRKEVELTDVIRATPAANLWLIPAGRVNSQTLQALAQEGMTPVLEQLRQQFDFLVIDSSPVLPVVDAMVIGQQVDVVIFSLLRNVSRIPNVYAAYQRLSTLGIRMLGAVVNGVHKEMYGYSYRYYARQPE
jgi:capsular exopolysaccharide synthesis family protein